MTITAEARQVADTILAQLGGGMRRIKLMTGAKNFTCGGRTVRFQFPNRARSKPNYVAIKLRDDDTYSVEFGRIGKYDFKSLSTHDGIYCDGLTSLFENTTGLALSL